MFNQQSAKTNHPNIVYTLEDDACTTGMRE